ncbi:MAG: alpha/beta fold hydrolase [Anaerolineales bacterium]|nr:alpha/beta fold hydrolase [Anaerolineales bacterium]MCB8952706.1 alpha/beta fold hydrolase [Ardenticatenales bacterium]
MIDTQLVMDGPAFQRAGILHRVHQPPTTGPHPTVVMLHGRAGNEDVMWVFARALPPGWLLVAPRAIKPDEGGYAWHPRLPHVWPSLAQFDAAVAVVAHLIRALPALYNADPRRLYLMGFSQGAALSYAVAMRHPPLVRGVAGLVGFAPTNAEEAMARQALAGLPVFMAVGRQDDKIPYERAQACATILRGAGADLTCREYAGGHKMPAQGMRDLTTWWQTIALRAPTPNPPAAADSSEDDQR